jgi:hypothetical protein
LSESRSLRCRNSTRSSALSFSLGFFKIAEQLFFFSGSRKCRQKSRCSFSFRSIAGSCSIKRPACITHLQRWKLWLGNPSDWGRRERETRKSEDAVPAVVRVLAAVLEQRGPMRTAFAHEIFMEVSNSVFRRMQKRWNRFTFKRSFSGEAPWASSVDVVLGELHCYEF